ncbi:MAG TPA: type II methionyl aminopeptidase [Conexivisphaerales archaeon]|nr:type II methionyl aminopeptidase [Conexivisphaerales archaeon]
MTPREAYVKAGKIASESLQYGVGLVAEDTPVEEVCEKVEERILSRGGFLAFPCNVSQNSEAAHYSASPGDGRRVERGSIVKLDIGVHVDGWIADTAVTVNFNPALEDMVTANRAILSDALKSIRRDAAVGNVGEVVDMEAARRGYRPIANLAGHQLDQYVLHAGVSVPNDRERTEASFKLETAYAVEPFLVARSARGWVVNGPPGNIYRLVSRKRSKDKVLADAAEFIWDRYKSLPFSSRWFAKGYAGGKAAALLQSMMKERSVMTYPVLTTIDGALVSQFEHTVYVDANETLVTTL